MEDWKNVEDLEFIEDCHVYLYRGVAIPSVTQLIHKKFPSLYANVPKSILQASAEFGTALHKAIECDCKGLEIPKLTIQQEVCFEQWKKLKEEYNICPIESELLVHHEDKYAGCLDGLFDINYERVLVDIKTTTNLNIEYLETQLGLYLYALKSMGCPYKIETCYAIHLPKGKIGKLVKIYPKKDKEIEQFLKEIENNGK